ncbi:MAG: cytochrome c biogenesis protein CcsA, partial [Burkholderiaceae bacterium]|nr:cytochrome c biogenesis protein CcsA [Burkholderiaceae bacterium]
MIAELAQVSLLLALLSSLLLGVLPLWGAQANRQQLMDLARPAAQAVFFWVAVSFLLLITLFLQDDFSVAYVAAHSNLRLPAEFKIAGAWGGHEGSMLLSTLMLAGWTVAVALFSKSLPEKIVARTLGVLGLLCFGFLLFTAVTSNPFERLWPAAADGKDLNPLLQDPGMIFHPPLLFMGYVGTAVAFALAMAALMAGRLDASWARWMRPWV